MNRLKGLLSNERCRTCSPDIPPCVRTCLTTKEFCVVGFQVLVNGRLANDADFLTDVISDGAQIHVGFSLVDRSQMRSVRNLMRPARRDELDCMR